MSMVSSNLPGRFPAKTFPQWLSFVFNNPHKKNEKGEAIPVVLISLVHATFNSSQQTGVEKEIHSVPVTGKTFTEEAIQSLAETLYNICVTDAQNLSGRQQYACYAMYDKETNANTRFPISVNGHIVNTPGDLSTEGPTVEGRLAQRMRHDEGYSQILLHSTANLINHQNRFIEIQSARLAETARENRDLISQTHQMLFEKLQFDREHELKVMQMQRNSKLIEGAIKFAPAVLNQVTGREIVPQSTADTAILEMIAENLDEEAMSAMAPLLKKIPAAAQGVMFKRLTELLEAKTQAEKRSEEMFGKMDPKRLANAELEMEESDVIRKPH